MQSHGIDLLYFTLTHVNVNKQGLMRLSLLLRGTEQTQNALVLGVERSERLIHVVILRYGLHAALSGIAVKRK